ncbi:hypothetical protein Lesp02_46290 [Lentzea sp. NBRC 105346]|uniref:hypothetical protein n=1 Tax=Lentzea sp. NBRC 105346 TaxID=3032205 RepID=UPI0024A28651|nr:hypothetical protein [Lentzea sp. NBRC 105346]GLZ32441.1 hypothetical protein Lesp02_46290 [Lentzea sp. NBRC 105346]
MATQERSDTSPTAALILVVVIATILTFTFGRTGLLAAVGLFVLSVVAARFMHRTPATPVPARLRRLSTAGRLAVVGEPRYQQTIRDLACAGNAEPTAVLVPEPRNRHDRRAVRVDLLRKDGSATTVGYLMKDDARRYQPKLLELAQRGEAGSCPARIVGGRRQHYGVHLHVGGPEILLFDHDGLGDAPTMPADYAVNVISSADDQEILRDISAGRAVHVIAELRDCQIGTGIHEGARTLEVVLDGERVGELPYATGQRYAAVVRDWRKRTGRALCEAVVISRSIRLLLPK